MRYDNPGLSRVYVEKAERYLEEAKEYENSSFTAEQNQLRKQTLILGSIAASLIALAKK